MRAIEQRLKALEASTEATDAPRAVVIIYDPVTGAELTPRPKNVSAVYLLPDNGRNDRCA